MAVDKVTENARKDWMQLIRYANDFVLIGERETMKKLRENFNE